MPHSPYCGAGGSVGQERLSGKSVKIVKKKKKKEEGLGLILVNYSDKKTQTQAGKQKDINKFGCLLNVDLWTSLQRNID